MKEMIFKFEGMYFKFNPDLHPIRNPICNLCPLWWNYVRYMNTGDRDKYTCSSVSPFISRLCRELNRESRGQGCYYPTLKYRENERN